MPHVISEVNPRHKHDCDNCVFLGHYKKYDLYCCPKINSKKISTVVARYGDDGPDYYSGLDFARFWKEEREEREKWTEFEKEISPPIGEILNIALSRAKEKGYVVDS